MHAVYAANTLHPRSMRLLWPCILVDEIGRPPKPNWAKPEVETRIAVDERHGTRAA